MLETYKRYLAQNLARVAQEVLDYDVTEPLPGKSEWPKLLKDAAQRKIPEMGWLALNLQNAILEGEVPMDSHVVELCDSVIDRWLGKARQSIEMSADHEFVEWLGRFRAQHDAVIEISTSTNPSPLTPLPEPEEVIEVVHGELPASLELRDVFGVPQDLQVEARDTFHNDYSPRQT